MADREQERQLLRKYARPIVHMRRQCKLKRLALVFGAGISKSFGLPGWSELIESIAQDRDVNGHEILERTSRRMSLPFMTEVLFQHFRKAEHHKHDGEKISSLEFENRTAAKWQRICAKHLYKQAPTKFRTAVRQHPYLSELLPIVERTPLTVNYNFDDFLERALSERKSPDEKTRGFETVTNPWMQFRRDKGVVYHPNGVIKSELMELPADKFIFSESSFARHIVGSGGDTSFLLNHFCKNTCLIVGASLEDESLRSALIWSANASPGNFHYCIRFMHKRSAITEEDADAIRRANFNVFNLITLFLTEAEIAALARLIDDTQVSEPELQDIATREGVRLVYKYYFTGAIGVGKSATARQLENLSVIDEWLEPPLPILAKPWDSLTKAEREKADAWIINQFALKNDRLRHENLGVFVIDRPPLDPLAFTPVEDRAAKAKLLRDAICPDGKWSVADGMVMFFKGESSQLAARVLAMGRDEYTAEKLQAMQNALSQIYKGTGIMPLDTRGLSTPEVTKKVAEMIFFEPYTECDLNRRVRKYR